MKHTKITGFTLIELITVIGIVAILGAIVIVAVNPARQFSKSRNAKRISDTKIIADAVMQRVVQLQGAMPSSIPYVLTPICDLNVGVTCESETVNLRPDVVDTKILDNLPLDPSGGTSANTAYAIAKDVFSQCVTSYAINSELNERIFGGCKQPNYALTFDGIADNVEIGNESNFDFNLGDEITIAARIYPTSLTADNTEIIIAKGIDGGPPYLRHFVFNLWGKSSTTADLSLYYRDANGGLHSFNTSGTPISINNWYHVAFVHKFGTRADAKMYINGNLASASWLNGSMGNVSSIMTDHPVRIGSQVDSVPFEVFNGHLDDLQIYRRMLSEAEVQRIRDDKPVTEKLIGDWRFNEGQGIETFDFSPLRNNAQISGSEWYLR